jgi:cysteine-rich repeat protein
MKNVKLYPLLLVVMLYCLPSVYAADQTCKDVGLVLSLLLGSNANNPTASFDSGGIILNTNTQRNKTETVTEVTDGDGKEIVTCTVTTTWARLQWAGEQGVVELEFPEPLPELPSYFAANRLAAYIAWQVAYFESNQGRDAPGCDLDGDILETPCGLACCANHDKCYKDDGCSALSWMTTITAPIFNVNCNLCNAKVVLCLIIQGANEDCENDTCYDSACDKFYECNIRNDTCDCVSPCDKACGNSVMDEGEECDDGNNEDGDECSSECKVEVNGCWTFNYYDCNVALPDGYPTSYWIEGWTDQFLFNTNGGVDGVDASYSFSDTSFSMTYHWNNTVGNSHTNNYTGLINKASIPWTISGTLNHSNHFTDNSGKPLVVSAICNFNAAKCNN